MNNFNGLSVGNNFELIEDYLPKMADVALSQSPCFV